MVDIQNVSFAYTLTDEVRPPRRDMNYGMPFGCEKEQRTLSHIDLQIGQGECVLLCGESGCGKTTVTKLVNGLIPHFVEGGAFSGRTAVNGMEVADTEMYRLAEQIGSVFQNPKSQFFNIDSDSEITFGLENAGVAPEKIKERLEDTVSVLNIGPLLGRNIFSLSGGEKQSLAFASVYAMNPSVFVLDEPTANLDAEAVDILRRQIMQIKKEGRTVIVAEHRLYFLMDLIDRAVFLRDGTIIQIFSDSVWDECELSMPEGRAEETEKILKAFDLLEFKERHPMALSGGQKQRLAMAAAILSGKRLLVFDEPTSGLDYRHMLEVGRIIRGLAAKRYIVLVVSHDREFMEKACDRIFSMDGRNMDG